MVKDIVKKSGATVLSRPVFMQAGKEEEHPYWVDEDFVFGFTMLRDETVTRSEEVTITNV